VVKEKGEEGERGRGGEAERERQREGDMRRRGKKKEGKTAIRTDSLKQTHANRNVSTFFPMSE